MKNTGIYQIKSIKTGRVYIGSAINIKTRWNRHKRDLFKNAHHSSFLQRHYNKYGINDLVFSVIEFCRKEELLFKEQIYLDSLNCEFNSCKIAGSCYGIKKSEEFKRKISILTSGKNNPTYGLERTKEWRGNISKANQGQKAWNKGKTEIYSENTLLKMKEGALNKEKILCEHCNNKITPHNFKRWHGENCDYKNVPEGFKKCSNCKSVLRGGITIRVDRFIKPNCKACKMENIVQEDCETCVYYPELLEASHPSETALDSYKDFDYIIENNGTIEELLNKVKKILINEKII